MANHHVGTHQAGAVVRHVNDGSILHVAAIPDDDGRDIAAQDGAVPDRHACAQADIGHHRGAGRDEGALPADGTRSR